MILEKCKIYWAKVVGNPRPNYSKDGTEWSFDLSITPEVKKQLKAAGASSYFKDLGDDRGTFIHLKRKGTKNDGTPAKPIAIVDHANGEWDGRLIGNGSTVNVSVAFNEYGDKVKKIQVSPLAIQVWDFVKYVPKSGFPTRESTDEESQLETVGGTASSGASKNW